MSNSIQTNSQINFRLISCFFIVMLHVAYAYKCVSVHERDILGAYKNPTEKKKQVFVFLYFHVLVSEIFTHIGFPHTTLNE